VPSIRPGISIEITREPLGVVGLITPWNFPIAIPAWKIAPALAYGNCVVIKPADLVPGSVWALAEIISRSGLPNGVFNLVMGRGSVVGEALIESPDVAAISFTGSDDTGRALGAKCCAGMKKFQLEMGGKNPLVVLDDADLKTAVGCAVQGAYYSTGQRGFYLYDLYVRDTGRGVGVGKALMAALARIAKADGRTFVWWSSKVWNHEAQAFYGKLGAIEEESKSHALFGQAFEALAANAPGEPGNPS